MKSSKTPAAGSSAEYAGAFGDFDGRIWLNAAHQGPLPRAAVAAAEQALAAKLAPHRISDEAFTGVPRRLRGLLGRLIGAPAEEIILANSASWGLQVLANGLPWRQGDEVLVLADEFPATVFPWLVTERHGVTVRQLKIGEPVLAPERLQQEMSPRTRVVAVNWVRSLTGHVVDVAGLFEVCDVELLLRFRHQGFADRAWARLRRQDSLHRRPGESVIPDGTLERLCEVFAVIGGQQTEYACGLVLAKATGTDQFLEE